MKMYYIYIYTRGQAGTRGRAGTEDRQGREDRQGQEDRQGREDRHAREDRHGREDKQGRESIYLDIYFKRRELFEWTHGRRGHLNLMLNANCF